MKKLLHHSWKKILIDEFTKDYFIKLELFLKDQVEHNKTIFPSSSEIFNALNQTPFNTTKVVIIGQDPYHGAGQANGLSFSVNNDVKTPPSLANIFKELKSDLLVDNFGRNNLIPWANQGVLLLNSVLTVESSKAGSHSGKGWEYFTDKIIDELNRTKKNLVFILWGNLAHKKGAAIDESKHLVLRSVHPSPLSSYRGFFGSKPFSKTNDYLQKNNIQPINWSI